MIYAYALGSTDRQSAAAQVAALPAGGTGCAVPPFGCQVSKQFQPQMHADARRLKAVEWNAPLA